MSQFYNIGKHGDKVVEYHGLWSGLVKGKLFTVHKPKPSDRYPDGYNDGDYSDSRGHHRRRHRHHDSSRRRDNTDGYDEMSNGSYAQSRPPWLNSRESPFQQYRRQEATNYQQSNHRYYDSQNDDYPEARYKEQEYHDDGYQSNAYPYNAYQRNAYPYDVSQRNASHRGNAYQGNAYQDEGNPTRRVGALADTRRNTRLTNESPRNNARRAQQPIGRYNPSQPSSTGRQQKEASSISSSRKETTVEAGRPWKQCEDDLLRSLLRAGKTREEAAQIIERTIKEVDDRNTLLVQKEKAASSASGSSTTEAPVSNASASAPTSKGTPTAKTASMANTAPANTAPTNTTPATSALAKSAPTQPPAFAKPAPTKLGPVNDKGGPCNSFGVTKPNTPVEPVLVGGLRSDSEGNARSVDEEEKQSLEQRLQEESMVGVLSHQYTLPPRFYDKVKATRQFSRLDCKLLALLEQKHTNTNKWTDIQVDFLGATGRLVAVQELRQAFQCGPGNCFSAPEHKTLSFLHNKQEHDKWRAIQADFRTGTGRLVPVELLKNLEQAGRGLSKPRVKRHSSYV
ncbi:hypothetical protein GE09DRAFT_1059500 [Coniochaeta sp. 2T2.1]|nr:hypothetical protein GE09DRAFT_1059500 [Coniochaeta sp. 2T2.1]